MKKGILIVTVITILIFFMLILTPLPTATSKNSTSVTNIVENIREGEGEADIVFEIRNDDAYYYINRGMERELNLENLQDKLISNEVTIYYINRWSLLGGSKTRHISKVVYDEKEIYNEIQK